MKNINEMKQELKRLGADIRETRIKFKNAQRDSSTDWSTEHKFRTALETYTFRYRHLHIAYGLLRGKEYKEIERKTKPDNEPSWGLINGIIEDFNLECA